MGDIKSSYQFHRGLESPVAFLRREWPTLAVFGGAFVVILLVAILAVDPAYFYPRLQTDPLLYWLKGMTFAETGHTAARVAVNRPPFQYVAMPGLLRAPFMMAFRDFDDQLRAIQVSNILLVGATAVMHSYVFSWALPRSRHWMAIGYSFGFMLLSPLWVANVFGPLADAPYAAASIGVLILTARLLGSDRPLRSRPFASAGQAVLFIIAFMVKFTAPVLLAYAALLAAGRMRARGVSRRVRIGGAAVVVAGVILLVVLNWETLNGRYSREVIGYVFFADKMGILLNLTGLAMPAQIIPVFALAFENNPIVSPYRPVFGTTLGDTVITAIGIAITAVCFFGMWRSRHRFLPEIGYFLAALPVLALVIPSTLRYLLPYQPLVWIFFYVGASILFRRVFAWLNRLAPIGVLTLLLLSASGLVYLRSERVVGTAANRSGGISIGKTRAYIYEVSSTFRDLRRFLETLPRDRVLLVGIAPGTIGRWKAIAGLDYYRPDSAFRMAVAEHEIYVVLECGAIELCQNFAFWEMRGRELLKPYGEFALEQVFFRSSQYAKAKVYRLRNLE